MGHAAKARASICDVTDELEAAIVTKQTVRVHLEDGTSKTGRPLDLNARDREDILTMDGHVPIPVTKIVRVERV